MTTISRINSITWYNHYPWLAGLNAERMATSHENTLRIMIATDNHLGYNEKDAIRGNDSFDTFEEILQIARTHDVDCMLLGGDIFHDNRPSRKTLHRTMEMLRHYCMGSKPCAVELLSDPAVNFPSKFGTVNYEDPNYNVALPVFTIHGNHDDPTGDGNLSSIDLLATAGLVNYFGKTTTVDDITIVPVLLRKGTTKLALYGLGAIRDERLHRTFLQRKVTMLRPPQPDDWFSMMILHQNRAAHGPTSYIPETFLDEFLDLVVWGHEHECQACEPTSCPQQGFTVCQPGSSVATSLSEGETKRKHVVILEVTDRSMNLVPIPLRSVRPFVMRDVVLRDVQPRIDVHDTKRISGYLNGQVEEMIALAQSDWDEKQSTMMDGLPRNPCPLPLVRLRVDYSADLDGEGFASAYSIVNPQRFGQPFASRIANPRDVVSFMRRRAQPTKKKVELASGSLVPRLEGRAEAMRVEDLVSQFLANQKLDIFPQNEFSDTLRIAVEKDDRDALELFVKTAIDRTLATVRNEAVMEKETLRGEFERSKRLREDEWHRLHPGIDELLASRPTAAVARSDDDSDEMEEGDKSRNTSIASRGRGRGRGRGGGMAARGSQSVAPHASPAKRGPAVGSRAATSKHSKLEFTAISIDSDDDASVVSEVETVPATPLGSKAASAVASKWPPRRR